MAECIYRYRYESEDYDGCEDVAEYLESLLPDAVAETHCLECAPETVCKVEAERSEPYDIKESHPPCSECRVEQFVRVLCVRAHELLELHVSPEMREVEAEDAEYDNSEGEHVR